MTAGSHFRLITLDICECLKVRRQGALFSYEALVMQEVCWDILMYIKGQQAWDISLYGHSFKNLPCIIPCRSCKIRGADLVPLIIMNKHKGQGNKNLLVDGTYAI